MHTRYCAVHLLGAWVSRLLVTALVVMLVVAYTPIISRTLAMPSLLSGSSIWVRVRVRRCCRFSRLYMHFIRRVVSWSAHDGRGSLCWCRTRPQPAACLRWSDAVATGRTTSARKAHLRMALEDGVRRGVGPRLLVLVVRLLVLLNFGAPAHRMRGAIPPLAPHCAILVAQSSPNPLS